MEVQVEDVGPCKKLLKIEVPTETVAEELEKTYNHLNETVVVPGFRKGRVPRWLMEGKFGAQVNDDTKTALLSESFQQALKEQELKPLGTPKFDEGIEFEPGKPLTFGVTVEVHPDFEIEDYIGLELEEPFSEPTEAEMDEQIAYVRRRYANLKKIDAGSPQEQDVVMAHIVLRQGEEVYRDITNHQFIVGEHMLIGMDEDESTKFATSASVGETVEAKVKLPEGYPDEAKRGAEMTLALTVEEIRRPVLPELTEEWVQKIGFESLDEFRQEVKSSVERQKRREAREKLKEQLTDKLLAKVDFELPEDIINEMAARSAVRRSLALRQQGAASEGPEDLEKLKSESREPTEKAAKLYFILDKIAEKERIFATEEEVNARIEVIAANYKRSPSQVSRELENSGRLSELRADMREEKVKDFLLEKADVKKANSSGDEESDK